MISQRLDLSCNSHMTLKNPSYIPDNHEQVGPDPFYFLPSYELYNISATFDRHLESD